MESYRKFRKEVLRMSEAELAALLGCNHTTVSGIERQENNRNCTKAFYLLLMADPAWGIKIMIAHVPFREEITDEEFELLVNIAKRYFTREEYPTWLELIYTRHQHLNPKTSVKAHNENI